METSVPHGDRQVRLQRMASACQRYESLHHLRVVMTSGQRQVVDFELESSRGNVHTLRQHLGQVVIVFYEARDRVDDNAALKRTIQRFDAAAIAAEVALLAVGNVKSFDFVPARSIARTTIRAIGAHLDVEILLDWKGVLAAAPFSLDPTQANVLVIDRAGTIVYRHSGVVGREEEQHFVAAVSAALGLALTVPPK